MFVLYLVVVDLDLLLWLCFGCFGYFVELCLWCYLRVIICSVVVFVYLNVCMNAIVFWMLEIC